MRDPAGARAIAALDCEAIEEAAASTKADGLGAFFASLACAAGILRECPTPSCEPPPPATSCADDIALAGCAGCDYCTACREQATSCEAPAAINLGFAKKYCERFLLVLSPRMSPAGQVFLASARDCLMEYVEANLTDVSDCSVIRDRALASHVACYADNGFCELPFGDRCCLLMN